MQYPLNHGGAIIVRTTYRMCLGERNMQQWEMIAPVGIGVASDVGIFSSNSGYLLSSIASWNALWYSHKDLFISLRWTKKMHSAHIFWGKPLTMKQQWFLRFSTLMFIQYLGRCRIIFDRGVLATQQHDRRSNHQVRARDPIEKKNGDWFGCFGK